MHVIHRYPDRIAAERVCLQARKLTNAKLWVDRIPYPPEDDTRQDPPGFWCITTDTTDHLNNWRTLSRCCHMGLQLALAEALRSSDPDNPLLTIWHLREESEGRRARYDISYARG